MKNLICAFILSLIIVSCGKYEEGPDVSFRSRQKRIEGLWKVDKFIANDVDSTSQFIALFGDKIDITDDRWEMPKGAGLMNFSGDWSWETLKYYTKFNINKLDSSNIRYSDTLIYGLGPFNLTQSIKWEIMRIAKKELFMETEYKNLTYRIELKLDSDH